ncbi:MAG TPA: hypothetical protein VK787_03845, partial [Puia sp.]|nr:hypothetical protein [Puia sp.]
CKQYYPVNNQEDEDSSTFPLYPNSEYIYEKVKKKKKPNAEIKTAQTIKEIDNQHEKCGK